MDDDILILRCTANIAAAYVSNNRLAGSDLPGLIGDVHAALAGTQSAIEPTRIPPNPAVPIRQSIKPDYIVCLEDGRRLKTLKRYLRSQYGMSPDDYRQRWSLPADYPMVAPNYAERRSQLAKASGLGRTTRRGLSA